MAFDSKSLDDYVDVAERMTEFYDRYPEGSLRAAELTDLQNTVAELRRVVARLERESAVR